MKKPGLVREAGPFSVDGLEDVLRRELQLARSRPRTGDLAEVRAGSSRYRIAVADNIEHVEGTGPEANALVIGDGKVLERRRIVLLEAGNALRALTSTPDGTVSGNAVGANAIVTASVRASSCGRVVAKPLSDGAVPDLQLAIMVRTVSRRPRSRRVFCALDGSGESSVGPAGHGNSPTADELIHKPVHVAGEHAVAPERQLIVDVEVQI